MYIFLLVIHVIVALFLIFIILIQSSKGEGLSDVFGGGGSGQTTIFGTRTGNFLTKATTGSAIIFMITCLSLAFMSRKQAGSVVQQELFKEKVTEKVQQILETKKETQQAQVSQKAPEEPVAAEEKVSQTDVGPETPSEQKTE